MIRSKIQQTAASVIIAFVTLTYSSGQINKIGNFAAAGVEDAQKLMTAYITPWANALGTSMSGGWYNTAKVHKTLGFDLTVTFNMGFVPVSDKTFNLDEIGLSDNLTYTENIAPTAAGRNEPGPELRYEFEGYQLAAFNSPKGTGLSFVPSPMVQLGVGIVKGTAVDFRFLPEVKIGNTGNVKLWGVGLKHDVLQWIPGLKKLPVLNVALQGGYTAFTLSNDISFMPDDINVATTLPDSYFEGQRMRLEVQSITANFLVSANLPVICFYGAVGLANTSTSLNFDRFYPVPTLVNTIPVVNETSAAEIPSIEIRNNEGSLTKPRYNIGLRLKFGVITIHGDYTYSNYSNVTAGLGISFR
ncbi:MAG: hypothetical protein JW723_11585 [Bacteroidales bacterium]|nr:hypothetical protein [Bacteroidales bacterium]